jgi:hypothetical protein
MNEEKEIKAKVLLKCSVEGCPRTKKIEWDDTMPIGTVIVEYVCPWHMKCSEFEAEERYFDKDGKELYWELEDEDDE